MAIEQRPAMRRKTCVLALLGAGIVIAGALAQWPSAVAMTVEEARKLAASKTAYGPPPRTIDDISKVLEQNRPDPNKIRQLRATADQKTPPGLSGMALADFLNTRGLAARDLGRTQQRLADLRQAWQIAKPLAMRKAAVSVLDTPTAANPEGSARFQAFVAAKRAARQAQGGPGGGQQMGWRSGERNPDGRTGMRGGGAGPGGGPRGYQPPQSAADARERLNQHVPPEQQRAIRIMQNCAGAEMDAGNYRTAAAILEEVRPSLVASMPGTALSGDVRLAKMHLKNGNVDAARRALASAQQLNQRYRQYAHTSMYWNNFASMIDSASGSILLATGKLAEAEAKFRSAMRLGELSLADLPRWISEKPAPGSIEAGIAGNRLSLGLTLTRQGKLIEAEVETRRALLDVLRLQSDGAPQTANTVLILADILQAQGRYRDAQRLAQAALDIYVRGGVDPVLHADALQRIAVGQASQGRWDEAMATYEKLKTAVANNEAARKRYMDGNLDLAVALVRSGQANAAIPSFEAIVKKRTTEGGDNEYAVAEARGFLGTALAAAGRSEEAIHTLRASVPLLISASDASAKEEGAVDEQNRRQLIVDGYFTLLTQVRGTELEKRLGLNATDEAFRMADVAHAKAVHSAIAASSARAASGEAGLMELIRQAQDIDQQIAAMSDLLKGTLEAPADQQSQGVIASLRKDIAQVREARKTLRKEIERRFPQFAQLVSPKPVGIADAQALLHDGDALLVTSFSNGRGYVWAIPKRGEVAFAQVPIDESEIVRLIEDLQRSVNPRVAMIGDIPPFSIAAAHKLYASLLEPVAAGWRGAKNIVVVPHGALGRLPFSLLVTRPVDQPQEQQGKPLFAGYRDVPFLIREAAVTHIPSVAAFMSLRSVPAGSPQRKPFIGFGDPWFSADQAAEATREQSAPIQVATRGVNVHMRAAPNTAGMASAALARLPRLPETADEVREIARALGADGATDVLVGVKASEKAVRSLRLDDRRVVMFATHGLIPGELDGLVQPALALSSPEIPGVEGDGLLTVEKILGLKLDADWVVLSACNTAAGEGSGAEAVSGLGRAFFYAGARALLVTHWPVETDSARTMTTELFRRQAAAPELGRAVALQEAMEGMIAKGERVDPATSQVAFTYAHPIFWAPFALIGDGDNPSRKK